MFIAPALTSAEHFAPEAKILCTLFALTEWRENLLSPNLDDTLVGFAHRTIPR